MPFITTVPNSRIEPLAWLGKTDWLTPSGIGYKHSREESQLLLNKAVRFGDEFAEHVRAIVTLSTSPEKAATTGLDSTHYAHMFFLASKVLASGQKTIRLSTGWCEAFENTELTLPFREYKQPFQTMVVELPLNYVKEKRVPESADYPEYVAVHLDEVNHVLLVQIGFHDSQNHLPIPFSPDDDLEHVLNNLSVKPSAEADYSKAPGVETYIAHFVRIALNAVIAMVYGTGWHKRDPTYLEKEKAAKLKAKAKSTDFATARRAKLRLGAQAEIYEFDQETEAFLEEQPSRPDGSSEPTGTIKKPHWRRGHWRRQPVGPKRLERELRWIRPVLIHADRFKGDVKDTSTSYESNG